MQNGASRAQLAAEPAAVYVHPQLCGVRTPRSPAVYVHPAACSSAAKPPSLHFLSFASLALLAAAGLCVAADRNPKGHDKVKLAVCNVADQDQVRQLKRELNSK